MREKNFFCRVMLRSPAFWVSRPTSLIAIYPLIAEANVMSWPRAKGKILTKIQVQNSYH